MTSALRFTAHATTRMAQRGLGDEYPELIKWIGTEVEGGFLVRERDFQALDRELKRIRERARRLVGKRLVIQGDVVVTTYHAVRDKTRRLLRDAKDRSLSW